MEDPPLPGAGDSRFTMRLRLDPVSPANAADLWLVHNDAAVWPWYGNEQPGLEEAGQWAQLMGESWRWHGVHKWIAYDRMSGEVAGRGGLSRTPVDDDWGQIYAFLPAEPWVRAAHEIRRPFAAHANWLEIGWALRREYWGRGYASEIGRAGLAFAFGVLGVQAVVSCTVRHNVRSRAVMERIGMRYAGEIRSRGLVDGVEGEQDDAPFAVCVLLRKDWDRLCAAPVSASAGGVVAQAALHAGPGALDGIEVRGAAAAPFPAGHGPPPSARHHRHTSQDRHRPPAR